MQRNCHFVTGEFCFVYLPFRKINKSKYEEQFYERKKEKKKKQSSIEKTETEQRN